MASDKKYGGVISPCHQASPQSVAESPFNLGSLCADLLEGVLQRLRPHAKKEAENVDSGFAAISRRRAWRHRRELIVYTLDVGSFSFDPSDRAHPVSSSLAASRFLIARCPIRRVVFDLTVYDQRPVDLTICGPHPRLFHDVLREKNRQIISALLAAERGVKLRALLLHCTAKEMLGGSELVVKLFERHSTTLQEAGLFFSHNRDETALYDALCTCQKLCKLTVFLKGDVWLPSKVEPLAKRLQLQLTSLTLHRRAGFDRCDDEKLASLLHLLPRLTELRLNGLSAEFKGKVGWPALANVRLLRISFHSLALTAQHEQAHMNWLFSHVLPNLESLILAGAYLTYETCVYLKLLKKMVGAFLDRPGEVSLTVELRDKYLGERWVSELRENYPNLIFRRFTAAVRGGTSVEARPSLPPEFTHAAKSTIFELRRPNESRCITIAVWN